MVSAIEIVYVARGRIAPTYLADAGVQFAFLAPGAQQAAARRWR